MRKILESFILSVLENKDRARKPIREVLKEIFVGGGERTQKET